MNVEDVATKTGLFRRLRCSQRGMRTTVGDPDRASAKNPPEEPSGGSSLPSDLARPYAFIAPLTASAVIGSERTRAPQALKIALPSAGAITVTAGSPTPVAFSPLAMTLTATSGIWLIRSGV